MIEFFDANKAINAVKEAGIHEIRCSMTGRIISTLTDEAILAAIRFEYYENPVAELDIIIDAMETRWLIQSSRPAPHLTAHKSRDGFRFLKEYYPVDLFAILASRLVFENTLIKREMDTLQIARIKMSWLREMEIAAVEEQERFKEVLESLIRLDAIHNIRHCLYSQSVKTMAEKVRYEAFDFESLCVFIDEVENCGFIALTTMKNPPAGNSMSLSAAMEALTPEQITAIEEAEENKRQAKLREYNRIAASARSAKGGNVQIRRGVKAVVDMADVVPVMPAKLAAKYANELESKKKKPSVNKPKKAGKSLSRFGNLDLSTFEFDIDL